jgi:hypothetical protein
MHRPLDLTASVQLGTDHPVLNCVRPHIWGGQWIRGTKYKYDAIPVNNKFAPDVQVQGKIQPIQYTSKASSQASAELTLHLGRFGTV